MQPPSTHLTDAGDLGTLRNQFPYWGNSWLAFGRGMGRKALAVQNTAGQEQAFLLQALELQAEMLTQRSSWSGTSVCW